MGAACAGPRKGAVWIVDDSPLDLAVARRAFSADYRLDTFTDGSAMLERMAGEAPDVLVLDWVMPGVSGIDLCHFLRSREETLELPILILTALRETGQVVEGLAAGANDYLKKPFAPEELVARVDALVRGKRLRERAERAEATVRSLLEHLPDPLVVTDRRGLVTFANAEAEARLGGGGPLAGRRLDEVIPAFAADLSALAPAGATPRWPDVHVRDRVYAPLARALESPEPDRIAISLRDVTHQRQAEARRLDFYSIIAHDLRAPLAAMVLRIQVLFELEPDLPQAVKVELQKLKVRMHEMLAMVQDFLEYARLESPAFVLRREEVDLRGLAADAVEDCRPLAVAGKLRLELEAGGEAGRVRGDQRRLRQVLTNLIANAIKFTPEGGSVKATVEAADGSVLVRVEDTGRGIAPEALPGLFRRYTRALDAEHEVSGTGLGLMIVRQIIEAHGGTVGAESERGKGSTFWFRLPSAAAPPGETRPAPWRTGAPTPGRRRP
jgi:two-component system phosphate regulon sensor histidine kinase PhoR